MKSFRRANGKVSMLPACKSDANEQNINDSFFPLASDLPIPTGDSEHQSAYLADLLIAGLAIRCGTDMTRVSPVMPARATSGLRHALSSVLSEPAGSVRFFAMLDELETTLRDIMRNSEDPADAPGQSDGRTSHDDGLNKDAPAIPPMPVQKRPW